MFETLMDALLDSIKILGFVFAFNFIISFFESKLVHLLESNKKIAPILGSFFGSIPQCGVSIVAADMYSRKHVSIGTLLAIFIACNDEALPIIFSNVSSNWYMGFTLLAIKIIAAIIVGYTVDLILSKRLTEVIEHHEHCNGEEDEHHIGCCKHEIEQEDNKLHAHLIHPLIHSLKIFVYILVINITLNILIFLIGENVIGSFLNTNKALTPLLSWLIGMIPNCASSVLLAQNYALANIPFSALLCGLTMNCGMGILVLIKKKELRKDILIIFAVLSLTSLILGYSLLFVF